MTTYNWYFSQSGNDDSNNGTEFNPWKTFSKAKTEINLVNNTDVVNLYFKCGDIWEVDTLIKRQVHGFDIEINNPLVNMNAYGSGVYPCIDGGVSDFSMAPEHNTETGPIRWSNIFNFLKQNCSVSNIEFKNVYGNVIGLSAAHGFKLYGCNIHNFGQGAFKIATNVPDGIENALIEYNVIYAGQQLWRYGLRPGGWGGGISLVTGGYECKNNIVRYNVVYDVFGEGIINPGGLTEYNAVGDTYSTAIYISPHKWDASDAIVRYNSVIMSKDSDYRYPYPIPSIHDHRTSNNGIGIIDEGPGGSNLNANIEIYGNICINCYMGIYAKNTLDTKDPFKSIKIYNNTVVDCSHGNYVVSQPDEFLEGHIYNNSSILYNRPDSRHGGYGNTFPHPNWTIENNAFWTKNGDTVVDDGWLNNAIIADPLLPGGNIIDWTGQSGDTYFSDIKFSDICPPKNSPLMGTGKPLNSGFDNVFLTHGTDFSTLPDLIKFNLVTQPETGGWDIGAAINLGDKTMELIPQNEMNIIYVDSEELSTETSFPIRAATNILDNDPITHWHTEWFLTKPPHPHEVQVSLGNEYDVCAFTYLSRQDGSNRGMIKDFEFYVSNDVNNWGTPVATGTLLESTDLQEVTFTPKSGRYVRLVALSEIIGEYRTSMSELNVLYETSIVDPCDGVTCHDFCDFEKHIKYVNGVCDSNTGECVYDKEFNSVECGYVPSEEDNTMIILGGLGLVALAMLMNRKK